MGFAQSVSKAFRNYFNFSGRAMRPEYWYFVLFYFIVLLVAVMIDQVALGLREAGPATLLVVLAIIIPIWSVTIRRLHDVGRSGWWVLINLIPFGAFVVIYWMCQPGEPQANAYGPPVA